MRKMIFLLCGLVLAASTSVEATELVVHIDDGEGHAVADAVVTVLERGAQHHAPATLQPVVKTIDQKKLAFVPYIEVFRPGDKVVFRNSDRTRHHVYSFSPIKAFEMVLVPGEHSAPLELDEAGVVAVGCNIHDRMISYLYVSNAPWMASSDATGRVKFEGLPEGSYDVRVWHPRLRPSKPDLVRSQVVLGASATRTLNFTLPLLPDPRLRFDREQTRY